MTTQAMTFDFHNTLASCDRWFHLETRTLVSDFLEWYRAASGERPSSLESERAITAYRALRLSIAEHGREQRAESCVAAVLTSLAISVEPDRIAQGVEVLMRESLADLSPLPGAIATVQTLARAGIPLGVVSSAVYHPFLEWSLERFELTAAFAVVVTSASCGFYKGHPGIYTAALDALRAEPERSLHVGDSYRWDVLGANRAGMRTAWLRSPGDDRPQATLEPNLILATLEGAGPILLSQIS